MGTRPTLITRRAFVTAAVGFAGALGASRLQAQAATPHLEMETIGEGLVRILGAGANVTVASWTDGLLLVDGGLREHAAELLTFLAESWPGVPVQMLFNTNWREEHTGANAALRAAGARIYAHENTKLWLGGDFYVEWEKRAYQPNPADALPTDTFYTNGTLDFGGRPVEYGYLPRAHTDGDIYVAFRDTNVLVVSDLLSVGRYPIVDYSTGGWIGGLENATQKLLELSNPSTQIVPAQGPVQTQAALRVQLALCKAVRESVALAFRMGMSLADWRATAPTREFDGRFGDPSQFLPLVYKGAWAHVRELGGVI